MTARQAARWGPPLSCARFSRTRWVPAKGAFTRFPCKTYNAILIGNWGGDNIFRCAGVGRFCSKATFRTTAMVIAVRHTDRVDGSRDVTNVWNSQRSWHIISHDTAIPSDSAPSHQNLRRLRLSYADWHERLSCPQRKSPWHCNQGLLMLRIASCLALDLLPCLLALLHSAHPTSGRHASVSLG
jgi:hypothetical protein